MIGGLALLIVASVATSAAGVLDEMDEAARHVAYCRLAAEEAEAVGDWSRAKGTWDACVTESERRQFADVLPALRAQRAISATLAEVADLRATDPHHWAMQVLAAASQYSTIDLPSDAVRRTFRAWMETEAGRAYIEPWRTVTVVWTAKDSATAKLDQTMQRYLEQAGLKWAPNGSPDVDVVVNARQELQASEGDGSRLGHLIRADATVAVSDIRFRRVDASAKGFSAKASAEKAEAEAATDAAVHEACDLTSQALLQRILAAVFPVDE